ncbi:MAG: hypothetical protein ACHQCI_03625 [Solirubrobacterales bacterium]
MNPVLTPTLLDPVAETFELSETDLGRLFGVSRQAVGQWRERGVPSSRMAKLATTAAICDLLRHRLKPERIPGIARRPARAYSGLSMLEMIESDRQDELQAEMRRSFDWAASV